MKHLLKFPQQKTNHAISYLSSPLLLELNDIKIINTHMHLLECFIPIKINENSINKINEIDELSIQTLKENTDWYESTDDVENIYYTSYLNDISHIYLYVNNKTIGSFNGIEKDLNDILTIIKNNNKLKDYNITVNIAFFGLFIQSHKIGNKWLIKNIIIEEISDNNNDWNKKEIEEDWEEEVNIYEKTINEKINTYSENINQAKLLLNEIKNEENIENWEKKILKLKKYILKL